MSHPKRLRLSLVDLTFAIWLLVVVIVRPGVLLNSDGDLARHIRMGGHVLSNGPRFTDVFSFTRFGEPFLAYEWGSQVLFSLVHSAAGLAGIVVFAGILIASAYALLVRWLLARGVDPLLAVLTTTAAAVLGSSHWLARPHLFSLLGCVVLLRWVEAPRPRSWLLLPLFALWANLHPGFVFGLAVLGAAMAGDVLEAIRRPGDSGALRGVLTERGRQVGFAALGTLITPFGPALHGHILGLLGNDYILSVTSEFQSPDFHMLYAKLFAGVAILVVAALAFRRSAPVPARFFIFLVTFWAALEAQRNIVLFGALALPLMALELDGEWRAIPSRILRSLSRGLRRVEALAPRGPLAVLMATVLVVIALGGGQVRGVSVVPNSFDSEVFPTEAVARARAAGLTGNLLTEFTWGGYVLYAWPEQRIFIDGMTDFFGEDLLREYGVLVEQKPGWRDVLESHGVQLAILPPDSPLAMALREDQEWLGWYADEVAVVMVRDPGGADEVVERAAIR